MPVAVFACSADVSSSCQVADTPAGDALAVSRAFGAPGIRLRDLIWMLDRAELPRQSPTAPRDVDELVHTAHTAR